MDRCLFSRSIEKGRETGERQSEGVRRRLHTAIGWVVAALTKAERYKHLTLVELQSVVFAPLAKGRIAFAQSPASEGPGDSPPLGFAFWATVSDDVDLKIKEQIRAGAFPIRLKPEEWNSGEQAWLLDIVAPSLAVADEVLANFPLYAKSGALRVHPAVMRMVSIEKLQKRGLHVRVDDQRASETAIDASAGAS